MTIVGAGATGVATILDGGFPPDGSPLEQRGMDRLFEIHPTALNVDDLQDLTIREGFSDDAGAGIQNWSPGRVRLEDVTVKDNLASKAGGGVNHAEPSEYTWLCLPLDACRAGGIEIVDSTLLRQRLRRRRRGDQQHRLRHDPDRAQRGRRTTRAR